MFDPAKNLNARLTGAVDLVIDFATLGEYGLEFTLGPAGRPRQGCADVTANRTTARAAHCDLLQESGLCRPTSSRVTELQHLRKYRDIRTAGSPKKDRRNDRRGPSLKPRRTAPPQIQLSLTTTPPEIKISRSRAGAPA